MHNHSNSVSPFSETDDVVWFDLTIRAWQLDLIQPFGPSYCYNNIYFFGVSYGIWRWRYFFLQWSGLAVPIELWINCYKIEGIILGRCKYNNLMVVNITFFFFLECSDLFDFEKSVYVGTLPDSLICICISSAVVLGKKML